MRTLRSLLHAAAFAAVLVPCLANASDKGNVDAKRIVSVGGTITEILFALGAEERIIARDSTSTYPESALKLPDVGYMRALSAEGVLGLKPDLMLVEDGSGPPDTLAILKASEVPMVMIPTPPQGSAIARKIEDVGAAVGLDAKAKELSAKVDADLAALAKDVAAVGEKKKRVLFVLSMTNGRIMAGGNDTEAGAIIELAGGVNAATGISGYKPLTDEAVIAAAPDVIVTMQRGNHKITAEEAFALPALATTPAAATKSIVSMDGLLLLGFGPRTPQAGRELASILYPGVIKP